MSIYHRDIETLKLRDRANVDADLNAAKAIAAKTVSVWGNNEDVIKALERAAQAYCDGNLPACVQALCDAYDQEVDHGDAAATNYLAQGLLEKVEDVEEA